MQSTLEAIVLEPISCDQVVISEENRYYDASMQFLKVSARDNASPTFDIDKMMTQYRNNLGDVVRITLPAAIYSKWRGPQIQVPTLWEMGGLSRGEMSRPSWCVIVGSPEGGRVSRMNVCQVRYGSPANPIKPSGRHAQVVAHPETMFVVAQKSDTGTICLVYRVDESLPWPALKNFPSPDKPFVALNCSLVGIRQITGGKVVGWHDPKRMNDEAQAGMARLVRIAQEKLRIPAISPSNIELFWEAAPNSADVNVHVSPEGSDMTTYTPSHPEDFVAEVIARIGDYRRALNGTTLTNRSHPLPASVSYILEDDGRVQISVEIPSVIEGYHSIEVVTYVHDMLPASLIAEPTLSWDCISASELISRCGDSSMVTRNIFTYC